MIIIADTLQDLQSLMNRMTISNQIHRINRNMNKTKLMVINNFNLPNYHIEIKYH